MATFSLAVAAAAASGAGCEKDAPGGLPPASEWKAPAPRPSKVEGGRRGKGGSGRGTASHKLGASAEDPPAGLGMGEGEDEGAGDGEGKAVEEEGEDPHGPDPGHGEEAEEECGPRERVARGEIRTSGEAAAAVKPGAVLYLSAVPIDPDSGQPTGNAIAVDRFEIKSLPMPFELFGAAKFEGDVVINAWTDGDGEARTREPGDAEGRVRARVPADGVDLVIDKVRR